MKRISIILVAIFPMLCSCSVKEERDECPCWLQIDLSTCSHYADKVSLKGWTDDRSVFGVQIVQEDFTPPHEEEVPRSMIHYSAASGLDASLNSGMAVTIREGEQSDRLYAYRVDVPAYGESAYDKVSLHKQYAVVAIRIDDSYNDYSVVVKSNWNGIDLTTLGPTEGPFRYSPEKTEDKIWYFRLPRQGDDCLVMEITTQSGYTYPYELGRLIRESGYDWNAEDLDDIILGVDYFARGISVEIVPWEEGLSYDETI